MQCQKDHLETATHSLSLDKNKSNETNTKTADSSSLRGAPQERAVNENQTIGGEFRYFFFLKPCSGRAESKFLCAPVGSILLS